MNFLTILNVGSSRWKYPQCWFSVGHLFLACTWSTSHFVLIGPFFCVCAGREKYLETLPFLIKTLKVAQLCPALCNPMDYTVQGILQARILEWEAFSLSRESSQPRAQTQVSRIACRLFTSWATREAHNDASYCIKPTLLPHRCHLMASFNFSLLHLQI